MTMSTAARRHEKIASDVWNLLKIMLPATAIYIDLHEKDEAAYMKLIEMACDSAVQCERERARREAQ